MVTDNSEKAREMFYVEQSRHLALHVFHRLIYIVIRLTHSIRIANVEAAGVMIDLHEVIAAPRDNSVRNSRPNPFQSQDLPRLSGAVRTNREIWIVF